MLAPRDTATRQRKSLDGLWRFSLDAAGVGRHEGWEKGLPVARARDSGAGELQRRLPGGRGARPRGRRVVRDAWCGHPRGWAGERIVLRFGSATHRAVVWVNGTQVAEHEGGYTPFEADVTDHVRPGAENSVTVFVGTTS